MVTSEERSPSEDCALDSEQFFELNVPTAMSSGNSGSKPIRLECTADPFGAAGISVDMQGRAFRAKNVYAVPGAGNGSPPLKVALDGRGQASDRNVRMNEAWRKRRKIYVARCLGRCHT